MIDCGMYACPFGRTSRSAEPDQLFRVFGAQSDQPPTRGGGVDSLRLAILVYVCQCMSVGQASGGQPSSPVSSESTAFSHSQSLARTNRVNRGCFRVRVVRVISAQSDQPSSDWGPDSIRLPDLVCVCVCVSRSAKPPGLRRQSLPVSSESAALSQSQCLPRTNRVNRACFRVCVCSQSKPLRQQSPHVSSESSALSPSQ